MANINFHILKWLFVLLLTLFFDISFAQKCDAEVLSIETTIEIRGQKKVEKHSCSIQINNRNGDSFAEISIPYNKMNTISDLEAYITDNAGIKVRSLKRDDIIIRSAISEGSFYSDTYLKEFSMRNNTYPYIFTFSYQEEADQFIDLEHWVPIIDPKVPTLKARLTIIAPAGYKIGIRTNKVDPVMIDSTLNQVKYQWQASYTQVIAPQTWSPSIRQFIPYVDIVPLKFRYETEGTQETWQSFGNWNLSLLEGLDVLPVSDIIALHSLTDSVLETKEKIRSVFHFLQSNTRYINVSIKTGGLKPYPASYVAEKKYGDCKALANYFISCLAAIGIQSNYTIINAGYVIETFDTTFASQQFNHAIVFVPLQKDTIWVDCTSDLAFGYLGTFTQNRPALILMNNNSKLVNTPALSFDDVMQKRKIRAVIKDNNTLECEFSGTYHSYQYEILSGIKSELSESERKTMLSRYIVETGFQLEKYSIVTPERDIPAIGLTYTAISDQFVKTYGNETLLKVIPLEMPVIEEPKKRKLPIQFSYPRYYNDTMNYILPAQYTVSALPENVKLESDFGEYHVAFLQDGQSTQVVRQLKIKAGTINPAEYQSFYNFYNGFLESEKSLYITLTQH